MPNKGLNLAVITVVLIIVLALDALLLKAFGFTPEGFMIASAVALVGGVLLYFFLSTALYEPFLDSKNRIDTIIANSLHELNTPIATIELNIKMLRKKLSDEKALKYLERIESSSKNLLKLYEKMEYRLKKEVRDIQKEVFSLQEAVYDALDRFKELGKGLEITVDIEQDAMLLCNKNGFDEILGNLISNAIKYNKPNGSIQIRYRDKILSIEDTGIGIDTKNLFDVFDRYFQEDTSKRGAGLGLNIVKDFCDKNNIKINIESEADKGSTFYLYIASILENENQKVAYGSY